ncbi:hypothetical protein, partial [Escherichia coli]|uniref:hypothetical protein n=1 Tax=Escherichia coli TaxID=562 RepID=UPI0019533008
DTRVWHIDLDPLKEQMPLWSIPARRVFRAHAETALAQLNEGLARIRLDEAKVAERRAHYTAQHEARLARLKRLEERPGNGVISA